MNKPPLYRVERGPNEGERQPWSYKKTAIWNDCYYRAGVDRRKRYAPSRWQLFYDMLTPWHVCPVFNPEYYPLNTEGPWDTYPKSFETWEEAIAYANSPQMIWGPDYAINPNYRAYILREV